MAREIAICIIILCLAAAIPVRMKMQHCGCGAKMCIVPCKDCFGSCPNGCDCTQPNPGR